VLVMIVMIIFFVNKLSQGARTFGKLVRIPANLVIRLVKKGLPCLRIFTIFHQFRLPYARSLLIRSGVLEQKDFLVNLSLNHKGWSALLTFIIFLFEIMVDNPRVSAYKLLY
jgi:hypothetical protein